MIDDAQLQQAVLAELNWDPSVPAGRIGVTASGGVVTPRVDVRDVANDIRAALHRSRFFDRDTIRVAVDGGIVRLTGSVDSLHDRKVAEKTAWAAPGAVQVENMLEIV